MTIRTVFRALSLWIAAAGIAHADPPSPGDWASAYGRDHALAGTIWNVAEGRPADADALLDAAQAARFVLLGETHGNPDHHRIQARVVDALIARDARPAVVFEMIRQDQQEALRTYLAETLDQDPSRRAAGLGEAVAWEERGWPDWRLYAPIARAVLAAGETPGIHPGDTARARQDAVRDGGLEALPHDVAVRFALDRAFPADMKQDLREHLDQAHCGLMPDHALGPMAAIQRLRDAAMAEALIEAGGGGAKSAILVAGREHARQDRGVPWYLRARLDDPPTLALAIIEVAEERKDWRDYLPPPSGERTNAERPVFDYIWFTPRSVERDHCAELAERLKKNRDDD